MVPQSNSLEIFVTLIGLSNEIQYTKDESDIEVVLLHPFHDLVYNRLHTDRT